MERVYFPICLLIVLFGVPPASGAETALEEGPANPPRLILQITVDQLRGDLPNRHLAQMGEGGFRYLLENGVVFANAHHPHANTETIVGHTTLATGALPAIHGMIGNSWMDRTTGRLMYNIEDARFPLLTAGADVDQDTVPHFHRVVQSHEAHRNPQRPAEMIKHPLAAQGGHGVFPHRAERIGLA